MSSPEDSEWPQTVLQELTKWDFLGSQTLSDGARLIGHVPAVAPLAYLHRIPAPLSSTEIDEIESALRTELPRELKELYKYANGLSIFSGALNVYGFRKSYQRSDGLLASAQPFDIGLPNDWERPQGLPSSHVVIGSYSQDGSKVCSAPDNSAYRCERYNACQILNVWPSIRAWLTKEVARIRCFFDEEGACLDENLLLPVETVN